MKKLFAALILLMLCACTALAEAPDYAAMTDEELAALREAKLAELAALNTEIGSRAHNSATTPGEESLGKIKDLFPDEAFALVIRDKCGKFSIEQTVTQAELDKITWLQLTGFRNIYDLTGIGYLRHLSSLEMANGSTYRGKSFPDEFYTLTEMYKINLMFSEVEELSPAIANLTNLHYLLLPTCNIRTLPDSIGNLSNLVSIDLASSDLQALPDTIGNLSSLRSLNISYTNVTELPESIWALDLSSINMAGLPIK